ncbi:glycosyltransferase, partial [Elusimicrobiota bacterium]
SCGMPVITTALGADGIGAIAGEHLIVADTPSDFAEKVLLLMEDNNLRRKLSENAYQFVKEQYDWPVVVQQLRDLYEKI